MPTSLATPSIATAALPAQPDAALAPAPKHTTLAFTTTSVQRAYDRRAEASGELVPPEQLDAVLYIVTYAKREGLSMSMLSERCGISVTTLSRLFRAEYKSLAGVVGKINLFCNLQQKRYTAPGGEFVETGTVRDIWRICEAARVNRQPVLLYGDSQTGKSTALKEYMRRTPNTFYERMPASGTLTAFENALCRTFGESTRRGDHHERIFRHLSDGKVLIIDELTECLHQSTQRRFSLKTGTLKFIREIYDRTDCGLVLCGTDIFRDEFEHGYFSAYLSQLFRRSFCTLQLPPVPPRQDLDAIAANYGLSPADEETHRLRIQVVLKHGLRGYVNYIKAGGTAAQKNNAPLTWRHFTSAHDAFAKLSSGEGRAAK